MILIKKLIKKRTKIGLPPGTPVYTGEAKTVKTKITIIDYNEKDYTVSQEEELEKDLNEISKDSIRWIKITGLNNQKTMEKISRLFNLHPLVSEDILNPFISAPR